MLKCVVEEMGIPDLVVYNVEHFIPGTILDIETPAFEECWRAMTLGGFIVGREVARLMVPRGSGTIIYTGATGAVRGRADYINMAVGKFGVRALSQSMARDLGPKGIHVAHVILDGGILSNRSGSEARERSSAMYPEHIAEVYYQLHLQHRSTWTQEMDLRTWVEKF
jgi:NAD(P)-dependent dehydrogenase (short-subunit alcohol dehydrogenase family)